MNEMEETLEVEYVVGALEIDMERSVVIWKELV